MDNFWRKFISKFRKPKLFTQNNFSEFPEFFKHVTNVLKVFGYTHYAPPATTLTEKFHALKRKTLSTLGKLTLVLSMIFYLIWMVKNQRDIMGMLRALPSISNNTFVATRYFVLYRNRHNFRKIYSALLGVYEDLDLKRLKSTKKSLRTSKILQSYGIFLLIFTQLSQVIDFVVNYIGHGPEVFSVQIWLPFDHKTDLTYFMSCFTICWMGLFCSSALYIGDWINYSITTVASIEFRVLGTKFRETLSDPNVKLEDLAPLINIHTRIIEVCNQLEIIMSKVLLHNCLQGTVIICLICFQIVILEDPTQLIVYGLVLAIIFSQIFLMCYHGQMLIDSSLSVADEIYKADWEDIKDENVKKSIVLLLRFSQIPKYLTARGFAMVSVALFTSIFNTSYSYYSLLKQVYDEKNEHRDGR